MHVGKFVRGHAARLSILHAVELLFDKGFCTFLNVEVWHLFLDVLTAILEVFRPSLELGLSDLLSTLYRGLSSKFLTQWYNSLDQLLVKSCRVLFGPALNFVELLADCKRFRKDGSNMELLDLESLGMS